MPEPLRSAQLAVAATFAVHALVSGSWAPRIPALKSDLGLDNGELGIALSGFALGLLLGTRVAGGLVDRFGSRRPLRVGLPVMCATLVGPGLVTEVVGLTAAFGVLGIVSGLLDVTMNANAVAVERGYRRPIMSRLHAVWSCGLLAGAALGAGAAALGVDALLHFALVAAVLTPLAAAATRSLLSAGDERATRERRDGTEPAPAGRLPVALLGVVAFGAFAAEGAAADWSAVYLSETVDTGAGTASAAFVAFSAGMIASRLVGDALSHRLGPTRLVRAGGALAGLGMALSLTLPEPVPALVGYLVVGLGLGPVVPIAFSAAGNLGGGRSGSQLGVVVTLGYAGSVAVPVAVGWTADAVGLRAGLLIPLVLALAVAALGSSVATAAGRSSGEAG